MKTIHLKTARVSGLNSDNTSIIERITVKLEEGKSFNNFIKHLPLIGLIKNEPPKVVKVLEFKAGKYKEIDTKPHQALVDAAIAPKLGDTQSVDFKAKYEKQAGEIQELRDLIAKMQPETPSEEDEDLIGGPTQREQLETKANELEITFNKAIGDEKLLERIQGVDPDFNIN